MLDQVTVWGVGAVSLTTLDELRAARDAEQARVEEMARQQADVAGRAEDRLADVGAILVPRREWWPVPPALEQRLHDADQLVARIAQLEGRTDWLSRQRRARASARLRAVLLEVAHGGAEAGIDVPDVEAALEDAAALHGHAEELRAALESERARLTQLDQEIRLREDAHRHLGFDSLHLAAHLRAYGVPVVQSPVGLGPGEAAHLTTDAALAPPAHVTPPGQEGSGGPALSHTGIHHWIGTLRSGPTPVTGGQPVDTGVLVLTSHRILFAGRVTSVSVPLDAMLAMDVYADGLAVLQLGREAADVFLVADPRVIAFYVNWIAEKA
ncbi:MAG TPA: hypothetical protein VE953_01770 [Terriglobales bacterium]|nr:hypothetical protein [Terriglobales bacterium]